MSVSSVCCEGLWSSAEFDRPKVDPGGGGGGEEERKIVADIQKCSARPRQREHRDRPSSHTRCYLYFQDKGEDLDQGLRVEVTGAGFFALKGHRKTGDVMEETSYRKGLYSFRITKYCQIFKWRIFYFCQTFFHFSLLYFSVWNVRNVSCNYLWHVFRYISRIFSERSADGNKAVGRIEITNELNVAWICTTSTQYEKLRYHCTISFISVNILRSIVRTRYMKYFKIVLDYSLSERKHFHCINL